jgi:uncharacterized protein YjbI with pentapeptide repeats
VALKISGSNLAKSDFAGVVAHNGKFSASALNCSDFSGADLTGSSFKSSDLREASFDRTNLVPNNIYFLLLYFAPGDKNIPMEPDIPHQ